jgi:hypothetical protein
MQLIALGRLKLVSNLERTYGLRDPCCRGRGRTQFCQLMPRLRAMRGSHKRLSLVPLHMRGLALQIARVVWQIVFAEGGAGAQLAPRP